MKIEWSENIETTINELDDKHREIIRIIDNLISMSEKIAEEEKASGIEKEVRYFGGFLLNAFKTPEEFMIEYKYPKYDAHKGEHIEFLKNYSVLKRLLEEEGDISVILKATKNQAIEWMVSHMTSADKDFADFLKRNK